MKVIKVKGYSNPKYVRRMTSVCAQYGIGIECIVPGCTNLPRMHHIVPRNKKGTDALINLMPICEFHERNIHTSKSKIRKYKKTLESNKPINVGYIPIFEYTK